VRQPVPFGKYLLLDRISVGGMAEVFKAKSYGVEGFEKVIAIKRILPSMGEDKDFIKMFIDEAKIAGQLSHANICQIFELGKIQGSHFIAMEYIWGKDLLQIQNRSKRLNRVVPVAMACFVIAKACEGLNHAHKKRDALGSPLEIVHRDCSPQNILISYEGEVKVIDFGIARAASRSSRTQAGVLKGKFGYMSPEQVRGLPLDRRSDIFSLGTVLYESLTGERLFVGESDFSTLEKVRNADVVPPRELNKDIPEEVERICMKALSRDRDKRYQWCSEMQADLQGYLTAQEEVFASKSLGEEIRQIFERELQREKDLMERYKRVGRDGLIMGVPQAEADLEIEQELGEAPPLEGDPTVLGGPSFDDLDDDADHAREPLPPSLAPPLELSREFDDNPTEIFGEVDGGPPPPGPSGAQRLVGGPPGNQPSRPATAPPATEPPGPGPRPAAALSPRGFAPLSPPGHGPGPPPGAGPYPHPGQPAGSYPIHGSYAGHAHSTAHSPRLRRARRASAIRDVAIGVGIAAVVLAAFALGRHILAGSDDAEDVAEGSGTIDVSLEGAAAAEVWIDGELSGEITGGAAKLGLEASAGAHTVEVKVAGQPPCKKSVEVAAGAAVAVECKMAAPNLVDAGVAVAVDAAAARPATGGGDEGKGSAAASGADAERAEKKEREREKERRELEKERERELAKQRELERERALERERQAEPAAQVGYLICNTTPFARVLVDGKNTGKMTPMSPAEKIPLEPGRHVVTFVVEGKKFKYPVTIRAGKTHNLVRSLDVK
jgi:serine/threonine protein kinase